MRTRFLATDYFAPSSSFSDQGLSVESFSFPSLPVPSLPPDPHFPYFLPFIAVDEHPAISVAGDGLNSLPIASALSKFLAEVIPQALPVPTIPPADEVLEDFLYDRGGNGECFSSWESVASKIPNGVGVITLKKDDKGGGSTSDVLETSSITKRCEPLKELRFEVVEVDLLTVLQDEVASFGGEESGGGVTLSLRVPYMKIHLDFIDTDAKITIRYPPDLAESVYQVENIPIDHNDVDDNSFVGDSCFLAIAALDHGMPTPQLEVSRNSWELDDCLTETDRASVFHNVVRHLDEAHIKHSVFKSTEYLRSTDMDMLAFVCDGAPCHDFQVDKPTTVKATVQMDLVKINDNILLERNSALYPLKPDGTCSDLPCSIRLEEVQMIDFPSDGAFKMLVQSETAKMNISDEIFKDDFDPARCLYESMVSSELALVDDTFKSLPTPILNDDIAVRSMVPPIQEVLGSLKPYPQSAADGIYLDWHLLLEGPCNRAICCSYASMVAEVKTCNLSSELQSSCQKTSVLGTDFLEDFQSSPKLQYEDKQNEIYVSAPLSHDPPKLEATEKYRREGGTRSHSHMEKLTSEKSSSFPESISQSNGLNLYLNVRSGTKRGNNNESTATLDIPTSKEQAFSLPTRPEVGKLIEIHPISLSNLIQGLIEHIHESYISALHESAYWRHSFSNGRGPCISKQKLLELITAEDSEGSSGHCKYEDKMELIVLYALKQAAYYLCFFGLHAAHLYISNLTGSFENTPERLKHILCSISEAQRKSDELLLESHPSLSGIEIILRSSRQTGQKILIVADKAFWLPLGQKLTSMKITFVELEKNPAATYLDVANKTKSTTWPWILEESLKSNCILLDNKNIPASFPFSEFQIILEYGGPNKSSTLLSLAPALDDLPPLHFLYVKVDYEKFPVELVEDNQKDQDLKSRLDKVLHELQKDLQEKMNKMRLVDTLNFIPATNQLHGLQEKMCNHFSSDLTKELLSDVQLHRVGNHDKNNISDSFNFAPANEQLHIQETLSKNPAVNSQHCVPALEKSSSTSSVSANVLKAPQGNQSATDLSYCVKNDSIMPGRLSITEVVTVVNTRNHGKTMLFSRRSSYQQILALEKGGMKVVERDIDLPVDVILSAVVCLIWYDTRIFDSNAASADTSGITNFVEDISTNILTSVSFSFTGCIMVFEGEAHFLSAVMDSSDSLYAAAASLDMNLQIFFSHKPKSTDEIILHCIRKEARLNKAPSPDIPESESLAESFLTRFPSINPLSAYMILSSGGSLAEFLSWSHERRIQSVGKYLLSPQITSLFNALCKFGELGESRSVMTECSSIDSDISSALLQSPRKRKKRSSQHFAIPTNDLLCPEPLNQMCGDYAEDDKVFSHAKLMKFSDMENTIPEPPQVFPFDRSLNSISEGFPFAYQQKKSDVDAITAKKVIKDDFNSGLTPNIRAYNGRTGSVKDMFNFYWQPELGDKHPRKSPYPAGRPSFHRTRSHPVFPTSLEINDDPGEWNISGGTNETWKGHAHGYTLEDSYTNDMGSKYQEPGDEIVQHSASSLAFLQQDFGNHAISQGSGWEIDYLRQMNEKRRARQERSACSNSAATWNPRMRDGNSKILSPPPIDSFRYRDRGTPSRDGSPSMGTQHFGKGREGTRAQNRRARKDFKVQPVISHGKRIEPSIDPTWTPIDKRSRQKLSFATYGKEKQSKLVWRNKDSPGVGCGFRKRYREEDT